jgi:hypothetical protein
LKFVSYRTIDQQNSLAVKDGREPGESRIKLGIGHKLARAFALSPATTKNEAQEGWFNIGGRALILVQ